MRNYILWLTKRTCLFERNKFSDIIYRVNKLRYICLRGFWYVCTNGKNIQINEIELTAYTRILNILENWRKYFQKTQLREMPRRYLIFIERYEFNLKETFRVHKVKEFQISIIVMPHLSNLSQRFCRRFISIDFPLILC